MEELEKTYLIKYIPDGLMAADKKELLDIYLPAHSEHSVLRIRRSGDTYEITKKESVVAGDFSRQLETTIPLTVEEYGDLSLLPGKRVHKIRHYFTQDGVNFEIDVFQDGLSGLVLVDVEFEKMEQKDALHLPEFCLADVTQEGFIAGGVLCGKVYADIEKDLEKFNYKPVSLSA